MTFALAFGEEFLSEKSRRFHVEGSKRFHAKTQRAAETQRRPRASQNRKGPRRRMIKNFLRQYGIHLTERHRIGQASLRLRGPLRLCVKPDYVFRLQSLLF